MENLRIARNHCANHIRNRHGKRDWCVTRAEQCVLVRDEKCWYFDEFVVGVEA